MDLYQKPERRSPRLQVLWLTLVKVPERFHMYFPSPF